MVSLGAGLGWGDATVASYLFAFCNTVFYNIAEAQFNISVVFLILIY